MFFWSVALVLTAIALRCASVELVGQKAYVEDIEFVFQLPNSATEGVIVLLHGCSHGSYDWWPSSPKCQDCLGLPIEVSIVRAGLSRGFAMIAISSVNRYHKCWTSADAPRIDKVLTAFLGDVLKRDIRSTSIHILGASSGGKMAAYYAASRSFVSSVNVQISYPTNIELAKLPPTLFTLMSRDTLSVESANEYLKLIRKGMILIVDPQPLSDQYFHDHSNGAISTITSRRIVRALRKAGIIEHSNRLLLDDPRVSNWRDVSD